MRSAAAPGLPGAQVLSIAAEFIEAAGYPGVNAHRYTCFRRAAGDDHLGLCRGAVSPATIPASPE